MSEGTTAVAKRPAFELMAMSAKAAFIQVMDEKKWHTEIMFAMQLLRASNMLQNAEPQSIKNAIVNVALTGTTLNPAKAMGYLVPRDGKCCLDISYRGLAGIAMDSGSVKHIGPRLVYSFDKFTYKEIDGEQHIGFEKNMTPPTEFCSGPEKFWEFLVCGYVVVILHDGTKIITEPLPKWKLEKAMKTSKTSSGKTPWRTNPDEMCLKTLVKHAYKLLPQTDRMAEAVAILNDHEGMVTTEDHKAKFMATFTDAEVTDVKPEKEDTESAPVTNDTLQSCYKLLAEYSKVSGDSADDIISRLTSGRVKDQISLEEKTQAYVNDIIMLIQSDMGKWS